MIGRLRQLFGRRVRTLASVEAYGLWAGAYPARAHNRLMQIEEAALLGLLPDVGGCDVLDLGSGTGRYGEHLRARGAARVLALDNSRAMLRGNGLPYRVLATATDLPLSAGSVDGVVCGLALGHVAQMAAAMREMGRVLRPGGWALVSDFHPYQALRGARRLFRAPDGKPYAVEHHVHLLADYHRAARSAGLRLDGLDEPLYEGAPVVLVMRWSA